MITKQDSKAIEPHNKLNEGKYQSYIDVLKISISDKDNRKRGNYVP